MSNRTELTHLAKVTRTGPLFSMTTPEAEAIADNIIAAGYVKVSPDVLAEAKAALETLPSNAVEAHHKQVISGLLNATQEASK